jgi:CubicO group peptidase (beta-lactamase class C family)
MSKPEAVGISTERLRRVQDAVQREIENGTISGAVSLVARDGRVVHFEAQGVRDIESRAPMTKDTIFRIASMTKPVTAVAVLMMVEQNKIRLDDQVSRFIPAFKNMKVAPPQPAGQPPVPAVPASREMTIRDLLTHTAGLLTASGAAAQRPARPWPLAPADTLASYIPRLAGVALDFQPGTRWSYSPLAGGDVLGRIVEIASGQTFDQFLKRRVFDPLGMKDTFFYLPEDRRSRLVGLYDVTANGLRPLAERVSTSSGAFFSGGAGLQSTAEDYLRFAQMLANGGILNGRRLLSAKTVQLMVSNQVGDMASQNLERPVPGRGYGFFVDTVEDPTVAGLRVSAKSFGGAGTFGTFVQIDPKERLVMILMIQSAPANSSLQRDFENAVMNSIIR